jgi:glycosyltransferase involved in cell wall biosynthesis
VNLTRLRVGPFEGPANGKPPALPEVMTDEGWDGVLVPQRDPVALGNVIQTFLRDPDRRRQLGREAADNIRRRFDVRVCEEYFPERVRTVIDAHHLNEDGGLQ